MELQTSKYPSVEAFKKYLHLHRAMRDRFKLPMTEDEAYQLLMIALKTEVSYRYRIFRCNEELEQQVSQIARWLTGDSSKFGLLLCGECGNGKSTILKALQQLFNFLLLPIPETYDHYSIVIIDSKQISYLGKKDYAEIIRLSKITMLGIDDMGIEPAEVMEYGNSVTPMIDLLTKRYDRQLFTIITTNLSPKQIREHYGSRIADRFNEMMEKVIFINGSYRCDSNLQIKNENSEIII